MACILYSLGQRCSGVSTHGVFHIDTESNRRWQRGPMGMNTTFVRSVKCFFTYICVYEGVLEKYLDSRMLNGGHVLQADGLRINIERSVHGVLTLMTGSEVRWEKIKRL